MLHHSYKRPHYYLIFFVIVVILTAGYVIGITDIFNKNSKSTPTSIPSNSTATTTTERVITKIFGSAVVGDIGAGSSTAVAYVTQESGGTGTFFFALAFMKQGDIYKNTNPIFLGDRIVPQNLKIENGVAVFDYCTRKPDEPFTVKPSVCVTKNIYIKDNILTEINP